MCLWQLTDAGADQNLWGSSYDREPSEIPSLLNEVTQQVVQVLDVELSPEVRNRLGLSRPVDPIAYERTDEGRTLAYKMIPASAQQAITFFHPGHRARLQLRPCICGYCRSL